MDSERSIILNFDFMCDLFFINTGKKKPKYPILKPKYFTIVCRQAYGINNGLSKYSFLISSLKKFIEYQR